jgi:hypothetical protein
MSRTVGAVRLLLAARQKLVWVWRLGIALTETVSVSRFVLVRLANLESVAH